MKKRILVIHHKYKKGFYDVYLERFWFSVLKYNFWTNVEARIDLTQPEALFYQGMLMKKHGLSSLDVVEV